VSQILKKEDQYARVVGLIKKGIFELLSSALEKRDTHIQFFN
jgi:hypothetical protein